MGCSGTTVGNQYEFFKAVKLTDEGELLLCGLDAINDTLNKLVDVIMNKDFNNNIVAAI